MNRKELFRRRRGFTLMEVLLVLTILVILGSMAVVMITRAQQQANLDAAKSQVGLFKSALDLYHLAMNEYPTTNSGLQALIEPPSDASNPARWTGPYLDRAVPPDPWDMAYQYEVADDGTYRIWSMGPNRQSGDDDDLGNW